MNRLVPYPTEEESARARGRWSQATSHARAVSRGRGDRFRKVAEAALADTRQIVGFVVDDNNRTYAKVCEEGGKCVLIALGAAAATFVAASASGLIGWSFGGKSKKRSTRKNRRN